MFAVVRRRREIRLYLYSELAILISRYARMACHSNFPIRVRCDNEAYKFAMQSPEIYYSLKEKHFFEALYRTFLNFDAVEKAGRGKDDDGGDR